MGVMGEIWRDARIAVRTLVRRPGSAVVILITLGVGLGAATTSPDGPRRGVSRGG